MRVDLGGLVVSLGPQWKRTLILPARSAVENPVREKTPVASVGQGAMSSGSALQQEGSIR